MDYGRENHSISDLKAHLICVTKYRHKVLSADGLAVIEAACRAVAMKMDFRLLEFKGEADHVHLLVEYPPKISISQRVNALKGVSSRRYGQEKPPQKGGACIPVFLVTVVMVSAGQWRRVPLLATVVRGSPSGLRRANRMAPL